ncbi:MAG TPA: general stress protein [Solirubrobacteraceae bacterium]|nr:general stress protein [Solirubrobacteraceae bacterium]
MRNVVEQASGTEDQAPGAWRTIASFQTYEEAEAVVDRLSDRGFEVDRSAIVAQGLSLVEQVTGRTTSLRAGLSGALNGAVVGVVLGWLLGIFNWAEPVVSALVLAFYGLIAGAILGGLVGFAVQLSTGGRRDFRSVSAIRAERYDVMVDESVAERARGLL